MEAVRDRNGAAPAPDGPVFEGPPPATDRLPVVPLPVQDILEGNGSQVALPDTLRHVARHMSREPAEGALAEPGEPGGYQLQVSSFREVKEAEDFALLLRKRGHRAYVQGAQVAGRGTWQRVRIGPFRYKRSAEIYRQDFEARERMVTFIVAPPKAQISVGLAEEQPAAPDEE
jgi:cell division protein FtsN